MKLQLRRMSQRVGQRAVAAGLSAEDLIVVEEFTQELKKRRDAAIAEWRQQRETSAVSPSFLCPSLLFYAKQDELFLYIHI